MTDGGAARMSDEPMYEREDCPQCRHFPICGGNSYCVGFEPKYKERGA
jgi:radical SAM protein with 4Fe4S-binding SPASM domain